MTIAVPAAQFEAEAREGDSDVLDRLRGENLALQSILHGLCLGLSHMSELHREAVIQALDYAVRSPAAAEIVQGAQPDPRAEAFNAMIGQLRAAVLDRYRAY